MQHPRRLLKEEFAGQLHLKNKKGSEQFDLVGIEFFFFFFGRTGEGIEKLVLKCHFKSVLLEKLSDFFF